MSETTTGPCVICGFDSTYHEGDGEMIHDFRAYPAAPSPADPAAERIAAALAEHRLTTPRQCLCGWRQGTDAPWSDFAWSGHASAALLPVVDALAAERAAEELRKASRAMHYPAAVLWLNRRADELAAALRAAHHTDSERNDRG